MGNCGGGEVEKLSDEEKQVHSQIEGQLRQTKKEQNKEIKLLLLGTGESGKTTIVRQMKIIYQKGFSDQERVVFRDTIHNNVFTFTRLLIESYPKETLEILPENEKIAEEIYSDMDMVLTQEKADQIKKLLQDPAIKTVLDKRQFSDSAHYFFENLDRIVGNFMPTDDDILRARVRTTGVKEFVFKVQNNTFRFIDVGGQRSERKKWIHCFQDVKALIFCVALNEYDMKLFEDDLVNRMKEALVLWEEVGNSKWFANISLILFFNKRDLFEKKIQNVDLTECFPAYTGGKNYKPALQYIMDTFLDLASKREKRVFTHITTATSTDNMRKVFADVQDIIVQESISGTSF